MAIEHEEHGLLVQLQAPLPVAYRGKNVGNFFADMVVDNQVILGIKAAEELSEAPKVQLVNYLPAAGIATGLLINLGPTGVEVIRENRDDKTIP